MINLNFKKIFLFLLIFIFLFSGCSVDNDDKYLSENNNNTKIITKNINSNLDTKSILEINNSNIKYGIEGLGYDEFGKNPDLFFKKVSKRGINLVSFSPFDIEEGYTIIKSSILKDMGFKIDPDFENQFENILKSAKENNIEITIMIEALAHSKAGFLNPSDSINKNVITPKNVGKFIFELAKITKNNNIEISISEEAFDDEFLPEISKATKEAGINYIHFFDDLDCMADSVLSEDYGYYFKDLKNLEGDKNQARKNLAIGSYYGELGFLNIMYGAAINCNKEYGTLTAGGWGMGAKTHQNIALLRAVQFMPNSIFFVIAETAEGDTLDGEIEYVSNYDFKNLDDLIKKYGRKKSDIKKPIANLILDIPKSDGDIKDYFDDALLGSISTITNSILAAGYELKVSKKPIENAELYYVFSSGFVFEEGEDLPIDLLNLKNRDAKVFYQTAGEISKDLTPNWDLLLSQTFKVNNYFSIIDEENIFEPIPENVKTKFNENEYELNYAGYSLGIDNFENLGNYFIAHSIVYMNPKNINSKVLLKGFTSKDEDNIFDDETALVLNKDNIYFVNGNFVHFDLASFLTNLMSKKIIYNKPNLAYITTGENRNVLFTAYDTEIDINLDKNFKEIVEFDENGKQIETLFKLNEKRLVGNLDKFHLIIIK